MPSTSDRAGHDVVAVDLGGSNLRVGAYGPGGLSSNVHLSSSRARSGEELLDELVSAIRRVASGRGRRGRPVAAVGIAVAGAVDRDGRSVRQSTHLPIVGIDLVSAVEAQLALPVAMDNDGNCGALAEARIGAGQGREVVVYAGLGTGIAGGAVVRGRVLAGARGGAFEIGHMSMDPSGPACPCGGRGCLELYVSGHAIARAGREAAAADPESALSGRLRGTAPLDARPVIAAAREGDPVAHDVLAAAGMWLGVGLANVANIVGPSVIAIGGGVARAGPPFWDHVRAAFAGQVLPTADCAVRRAALVARAPLVGAGILAQELLEPPRYEWA